MAGSYNLGTAEGLIRIRYDGSGNDQAQQGLRQTESHARSSAATFERAGRSMGVAGVGIAAGVALATKAAIDFEKQISAIGAVSGATQPELDSLRTAALRIGADTSFSASGAALAMEELAKAGVSTSEILNGAADATVALAAAGAIDLPQAATIAANAMNAFGLTAKDLPNVVDLIAGAANASAIDVGEFGQSLQQAGAVANLAGVPFSDLATAVALMGNAGIKGSDAGTSLKTMLQNLVPQTKAQVTLMKDLGLMTADGANKFFDASGKIKSFAEVSGLLQGALKGMGEEQKLTTLGVLFGSDAIRASAILSDAGAAGFDKMAESMGKVSAADVAAERLNNTAGKIEQLKGSAETAAISFGTLLLPRLTSTAQALADFANWLNGLSPGMQSLIINGALAAGGLLLVAAGVAKVIAIGQTLAVAGAAIKAWTIWTRIAAIASNAWALATWALNAAFIASPVGWIVVGIIALIAVVVLIIKYHKEIWAWIKTVWAGFLDLIKPITDWFAGPFANFFVQAWNTIVSAFNSAKDAVLGVLSSIGSFFVSVFNGVKDFVVGVFNFLIQPVLLYISIVRAVIGFLAPIFQAVFGLIVAVVKLAWAIITAIFQVGVTIWSAIFSAIGAVISTVFNFIVGVVVGAATAMWGFIVAIVGGILAYWNFAWNLFRSVITAVWGFIGPYIMGALNAVIGFLVGAWNVVAGATSAAWNFISSIISSVWNTIRSAISSAANAVWSVISSVWNSVKSTTSSAFNAISSVVSSVWNAIVGIIRGAVNTISSVINGISAVVNSVRNFFNQLKGAAEGGTGSLISFVSGIPGRIIGALGNVGGMLLGAGRSIIQGLIDGITNMAGNVGSAVKGVLDKARNLLPFSPAKEGPFSGKGWTLYSGRSMVEALATGIVRSGDSVQRALAGVLNDANGTLGLAVTATGAAAGYSPVLGTVGAGIPTTSIGAPSVTIDARSTVNVPAPIVDADQIGRQVATRVGNAVATATSSPRID